MFWELFERSILRYLGGNRLIFVWFFDFWFLVYDLKKKNIQYTYRHTYWRRGRVQTQTTTELDVVGSGSGWRISTNILLYPIASPAVYLRHTYSLPSGCT